MGPPAQAVLATSPAPQTSPAAPIPTFSVIIPTHGRPDALRECLEALAALDYPSADFEVIVVDDGGPVSPAGVVGTFADRLTVRVLRKRQGGPGSARNAGAAIARGRILAFIDDDCVPDPGWLRALRQQFWGSERTLVGGRVDNGLPDNPYSTASQLLMTFVYEYYDANPAAERFFTTNNLALRAEHFRETSGFETHIPAATAEDKEFCDRWRDAGGRLVYAPVARVRHANRLSLRRFLRQHFNYGRGIYCFRQLRRAENRAPLRPEPLRFYADLLLYPLRKEPGAGGLRSAALFVAAQAATMAGALRASLLDVREMRRRMAAAGAHEEHDDRPAPGLDRHPDVPAA